MPDTPTLRQRLILRTLRRMIDQELERFQAGGDQPPENDDVWKGINRAETAISRAFTRYERRLD